ncbi:MAG: hypothetical protein D3914_04870 [Candidatus Electrothrix sp. LOE2]|nr:hypothetical protein [Candidatus Electrothrix sp. LOE2]
MRITGQVEREGANPDTSPSPVPRSDKKSSSIKQIIHRVSNGSFIEYQMDHSSGVLLPKERQSFVSEAARVGFRPYSLGNLKKMLDRRSWSTAIISKRLRIKVLQDLAEEGMQRKIERGRFSLSGSRPFVLPGVGCPDVNFSYVVL